VFHELVEIVGLPGPAGSRNVHCLGWKGDRATVLGGFQAPAREPQVPLNDTGRGPPMKVLDEDLEDVFF